MFLETSALSGENVHEAFLKCTRTIYNRVENGEIDPDCIGSGIQFGDIALKSNFERTHKLNTSINNKNKTSNCYLSACS